MTKQNSDSIAKVGWPKIVWCNKKKKARGRS